MLHGNLIWNDEKTGLLIISTPQQLEKVVITHIREVYTQIHPVSVARNLDSWLDASLSMTEHISKICSSSFYYLNNIHRIRKYLSNKSAESLIHAFIFICFHIHFVLTKLTVYRMVCQTAHWSNYNLCRMPVLDWYLRRVDCHITPLLIKLHWLLIHSRIVFKILLLTFKILHGTALTYLESLISLKPQPCYNLRRSSDTLLLKQPSFISKATLGDRSFTWAAPKLWMHCHLKSETPSRWTFLNQS